MLIMILRLRDFAGYTEAPIALDISYYILGSINLTSQGKTHVFNVLNIRVFELTTSISFASKSACDRAGCENGGICQSGFTDKGYQCVCLPGFTSAHCEKGIGNSTVT